MSSRRSRLGQAESSSGRDGTGSQRSDKWLANLPGLLLASGLAGVAWVAGTAAPVVGGAVFGILLGMTVRALWQPAPLLAKGLAFAGKYVLQVSVVLLGLGLSLGQLLQTGLESFPVMMGTLLLAFGAMYVFGRLLRVDGELRTLIGAGTAICGGSAIAATSAVIADSGQHRVRNFDHLSLQCDRRTPLSFRRAPVGSVAECVRSLGWDSEPPSQASADGR